MDIEKILNEERDVDTQEGTESGFKEGQETDSSAPLPLKRKRKIKKTALAAVVVAAIVLAGFIVFKKFTANKTPVQNRSFPNFLTLPAVKSKNLPLEIKKSGLNKMPVVKQSRQNLPLPTKKSGVKPAGAVKKTDENRLNDLFKLKDAVKPKAVAAPSPAGMPAGYQGQVPNFNGMPPNVLQNIRSRINGGINGAPPRTKVLGVSNKFAVIQYGGADLYLKTGDSFGKCTVMGINSSIVKIACNNKLKRYPIEFARGRKKVTGGIVNTVNAGVKK
ncbi:MAG: hypothetical protein M0Z72_07540 [Deltaproteobacteria bacterium]|nr:hypothetical protein [Deltaproteobacteria bacterium]